MVNDADRKLSLACRRDRPKSTEHESSLEFSVKCGCVLTYEETLELSWVRNNIAAV